MYQLDLICNQKSLLMSTIRAYTKLENPKLCTQIKKICHYKIDIFLATLKNFNKENFVKTVFLNNDIFVMLLKSIVYVSFTFWFVSMCIFK